MDIKIFQTDEYKFEPIGCCWLRADIPARSVY